MEEDSDDFQADSWRSSMAETGATINDVASAAKVSIRTVSRVLNSSPKVNAETRTRIQAVIDQLGYSPSLRARALAVGRSSLIGMVHDDPNALVLDTVQRGIVDACVARGYELVVHPAVYNGDDPVDEIVRFVRRSRVDGLIVLPPVSELAAIPQALAQYRVPVIGLASVRIPSYPAMLVSNERRGAEAIADHFIALGHSRIALITGPRAFHSATEREQGFRSALRRGGVSLSAEYVREGDYGFNSGVAAGERFLALPDPPTAIFASNDIMAAGVLKAATRLGIAVPDSLSVAGFDGSFIARMVSPALTTVHRPLRAMARDATVLLVDMIENPSLGWTSDLFAEMSLEIRDSTAPPPA